MDFKVGDKVEIIDDFYWDVLTYHYKLYGHPKIGEIQDISMGNILKVLIQDKVMLIHTSYLKKINDITETELDKFEAYVELKDLKFKMDYVLSNITDENKELFLEYSEQYNKIKDILQEGENRSEISRKENRTH